MSCGSVWEEELRFVVLTCMEGALCCTFLARDCCHLGVPDNIALLLY